MNTPSKNVQNHFIKNFPKYKEKIITPIGNLTLGDQIYQKQTIAAKYDHNYVYNKYTKNKGQKMPKILLKKIKAKRCLKFY